MPFRMSTAARNAQLNAVTALVDAGPAAGRLQIYTGAQPASPDSAATGTLLADVALADPSFTAASSGSATMTDPASVTASASGTAGWFRIADSTGVAVMDGEVSDNSGSGQLKLSSVALTSGGTVDIGSGPLTA